MSNDPSSETVVASEPPVSEPVVAVAEPPPSAPLPAATEGARVDEGKSSPTVEQETAETPRSRVQLNPTVTPEQARPIPAQSFSTSVFVAVAAPTPLAPEAVPEGTSAPAAPVAPPPHEETSRDSSRRDRGPRKQRTEREAPLATFVPRRDAVEVPPAEKSLDAELEAEIDAALSSAGSLAVDTPPVAAEDGTTHAADGAPTPSSAELTEEELQPNTKLKGKVLSIHGENVIIDLGRRASGILQVRSFEEGKLPEVGAELKFVVDRYDAAEGLIHLRLAKAVVSKPRGNWHEVAEGQIVDCMVTKSNKGGLEVSISNLRGFLPASQVGYGFVSNLEEYVGQKLRVKILEVNPVKKNLVVSHRAFLDIARAEAREEMWKKIEIGQVYTGTVKTIKDYGAFVDLGGLDGLLHVAELSWSRVHHPKDVLSEGQQVDVKVLGIDREKSKISLGMKQLTANPWQAIAENYPVGKVVHGKVTKTTDFGAFVELEPGVEGLIHVSELDHRRVHRVSDFAEVGKELDVKVLSVDTEKKRIALSLKALTAKPEREGKEKKSDEDMAPSGGQAYERKRKTPLKGGGTDSGGLLFGNPNG